MYSPDPFPHWVIDDFLPHEMALQACIDFTHNERSPWIKREHLYSRNKFTRTHGLPPAVEIVMQRLEGEGMREYLYRLTGIGPLHVDPDRFGGGQHVTYGCGFLGIHADFTHHPTTRMRRALNLLIYLNYLKEDDQQWVAEELASSSLELWAPDMSRCVKRIEPVFNRAVLFKTSPTSYHGHPEPSRFEGTYHDYGGFYPEGRRSLAVYYYVPATPEDMRLKTTNYQPRPWEYARRARKWFSQHVWNRHGR